LNISVFFNAIFGFVYTIDYMGFIHDFFYKGVPNVEVTGHKLTAGFDSRGGPRSEATTGARRTKLAVNLWSGAETR
jgi:hypothetical protein